MSSSRPSSSLNEDGSTTDYSGSRNFDQLQHCCQELTELKQQQGPSIRGKGDKERASQ